MRNSSLILVVLLLLTVFGCTRQRPSRDTAIHLNPNMDDQEKYQAQGSSAFFEDGAAMRLPIEGTVARGSLKENSIYYTGLDANDDYVEQIPLPLTRALIERGRDRFDIFCSPCHGRTGYADGIVVKKGLLPPPSFHEEDIVEMEVGYYFEVISDGIRNMPPYKYQIRVEDRWAIISYLRVLQRSQNATTNDLPESLR